MRKIIVAVLAMGMLFSGCKLFQKTGKAEAPAAESVPVDNAEPKVFSVPDTKPAVRENPTSDRMYEKPTETGKPVRMQSENFSFAQQEDQALNANKTYFVIIGSFSSNENANRYKEELKPKGFNPIVLHSETGYYRVCVNSYSDEFEARKRILQIRTDFPQYADTWLLIKK